jgi:hypothetical protein
MGAEEIQKVLDRVQDAMQGIIDTNAKFRLDPETNARYQSLAEIANILAFRLIEAGGAAEDLGKNLGGAVENLPPTVGELNDKIKELENSINNSFDRSAIIGFQDQIHITENSIRSLMGTLRPETPISEPFYDLDEALSMVDETIKSSLLFGGGVGQLIPEGSLMDLRQQLSALNDELEVTTDPERQEFLRQQIEGVGMAISGITSGLEDSTGASMFFTRSLADGLEGILFQARSVEDAIKGIVRQLASRAFITGIGALLTGGASLGKVGFLGTMFGGGRHTGGVVPGVGNRTMTLKGGESVLTPGQMKALGGMTQQSSSISPMAMERAFDRALSKHLSTLRPNEFAVLTSEGNRIESRLR